MDGREMAIDWSFFFIILIAWGLFSMQGFSLSLNTKSLGPVACKKYLRLRAIFCYCSLCVPVNVFKALWLFQCFLVLFLRYIFTNPSMHREWLQRISRNLKYFHATGPWTPSWSVTKSRPRARFPLVSTKKAHFANFNWLETNLIGWQSKMSTRSRTFNFFLWNFSLLLETSANYLSLTVFQRTIFLFSPKNINCLGYADSHGKFWECLKEPSLLRRRFCGEERCVTTLKTPA